MKKLIILSLSLMIFASNIANGQYLFKVNERLYSNEITGNNFDIVAIHAIVEGNTECSLADYFSDSKTLYLEFLLKNKNDSVYTYGGEQRANFSEIISKLISSGNFTDTTAKAFLASIFSHLEYGTKPEKYAAAQQLAGIYGYTLKPINEQ